MNTIEAAMSASPVGWIPFSRPTHTYLHVVLLTKENSIKCQHTHTNCAHIYSPLAIESEPTHTRNILSAYKCMSRHIIGLDAISAPAMPDNRYARQARNKCVLAI